MGQVNLAFITTLTFIFTGFLLKAGHQLRVYARRPEVFQNEAKHLIEAGAIACSSPAEAAQGADFIITNVMGTQDVAEVLHAGSEAAIKTAKSGAICIDHSTIDPQGAKDIAAVMASKGF